MPQPDGANQIPPPDADGTITLAPGVTVHPSALNYTFSRSSGPGGQSVNKLNTRAQLRVALADLEGLNEAALRRLRRLAGTRLTVEDELLIAAEDSRSQRRNREACFERLKELVLRAAVPPKVRRKRGISRAQKAKRLEAKRRQSEKKQMRKKPEG
jgi:ribosome-associated protein